MSGAAGKRKADAYLQRRLKELRLTTPQQQQLTAEALCQGVAARDPAWVSVLAQVVSRASKSVQGQLAAWPGLLQDLAGYIAHLPVNSTSEGAVLQAAAAAAAAAAGPSRGKRPRRSSNTGDKQQQQQLEHDAPTQQHHQQQQGGSTNPGAAHAPQSSRQHLIAAAQALADLLATCEPCDLPPYPDLSLALQAALRPRCTLMDPPFALAKAVARHYSSSMIQDQQLLERVMERAERGNISGAQVLVQLAPQLFQQLEHSQGQPTSICQQLQRCFTALLAEGQQAGATLLMEVCRTGDLLVAQLPGTWEVACSGLRAACQQAAAAAAAHGCVGGSQHGQGGGSSGGGGSGATHSSSGSGSGGTHSSSGPAGGGSSSSRTWGLFRAKHDVCVQYMNLLVASAGHLAARTELLPSSRFSDPLEPALGEALHVLLGVQPPQPLGAVEEQGVRYMLRSAWNAMHNLSMRQETASILGALFQQQPGLCDRLEASWGVLLSHVAEADWKGEAEDAARLAHVLLLSGQVPGQEQRRQQRGLLMAGVQLWDRVWPDHWRGRAQQLMDLIQLPHGPAAVARAGALLEQIFSEDVLGPEHSHEGWSLLLAAPDFGAELVDGVRQAGETALLIVYEVWALRVPAHCQALVAAPGLAEALAECCRRDEDCPSLDDVLCELMYCEEGQAYLGQQLALLEALVGRMGMKKEYALPIWEVLADWDGADDWLLQQPVFLEGVLRALVVADSSWDTNEVVDRLRGDVPFMEALLRQPAAVEELLRVLVKRYCHPQPSGAGPPGDRSTQLMLVEGLAAPEVAPRALALLLGLLVKHDPELSAGVFESMNLIQRTSADLASSVGAWGKELAGIAAKAVPVQQADEHLQALRRGRVMVQRAGAAAAAVTQVLEQRRQAAAAAAAAGGVQTGEWECIARRNPAAQRGARRPPAASRAAAGAGR